MKKTSSSFIISDLKHFFFILSFRLVDISLKRMCTCEKKNYIRVIILSFVKKRGSAKKKKKYKKIKNVPLFWA